MWKVSEEEEEEGRKEKPQKKTQESKPQTRVIGLFTSLTAKLSTRPIVCGNSGQTEAVLSAGRNRREFPSSIRQIHKIPLDLKHRKNHQCR